MVQIQIERFLDFIFSNFVNGIYRRQRLTRMVVHVTRAGVPVTRLCAWHAGLTLLNLRRIA
jgi:hypothetical protein